MRIAQIAQIALAVVALGVAVSPASARHYRYHHNGYSAHQNYEACRADKRRSGHQGIAIGAAAGGLGTAALGGNLSANRWPVLPSAVLPATYLGRGTPHRCSEESRRG